MDFWLLYLMTRTESVGNALGFLGGFGLFLGCPCWLITTGMLGHSSWNDGEKQGIAAVQKLARRTTILCLVFAIISILLPTRKDWYVMVGGYYVTHIEGIDKLPANVVGAANEFLERYQDEEKPKSKKLGGGA